MRLIIASSWLVVASACGDPSPTVSSAALAPEQAAPPRPTPPVQSPQSVPPRQTPAGTPSSPSTPAALAASKAPVRLQPSQVNFGFVQPHTKLETKVAIVNDLDRPLTIIDAKPSCQCTTVDLIGKIVPPRGTLEFPISMKVASTGIKQASVQIAMEGYDRALIVELRADVVYAIRGVTQNKPGAPADPYIDASTDPSRVRGEVTVQSLDGKPFRVMSVGMKPPQFIDWEPSQPPRSSYRVRYDISAPDCPSMPRYLIIETDRPESPLIDMRVRHQCTHIKPVLGFAEFRANAGIVSPAAPGVFEIEIKRMGTPGGAGTITAVASTRPDMKAELVEQTFDGESVLAKVRITPIAGTKGVMLFPVRFSVAMPGQPALIEEQLLVYCKAVP